MENEAGWVWLKHEGHNGLWKAPEGVVKAMEEQGWYPTDERPVEVDPTKAEMPREWFEQEAPAPEPKPAKKSAKSAASADTEGSETVG